MLELSPTPLESALLAEFHRLYCDKGFPDPQALSIVGRENTGAGRYVMLRCSNSCSMENGHMDLAGQYIAMTGIPNGLMAVVLVADGCPCQIEIAVYGGDYWDGAERRWTIE